MILVEENVVKSKKVSVIVPICNVQEYVEKCIDSIINQTYKNLEIILIDDGSTDESGVICDKYLRYENVKVVHKKNGGLSAARNTGIKIATGEYITFMDGDDWADETMIQTLVWLATENDADIATILKKGHLFDSGEIIIGDGKRMLLHILNTVCFEAWGKLYDRRLFDDSKFLEGKICEDLYIMPELFLKCEKAVVYHKGLYNYRLRDGSISDEMNNSDLTDLVECCLYGIKQVEKLSDDKQFVKDAKKWYLYHILWYYYNVIMQMSVAIKKTAVKKVGYFYRKTFRVYLVEANIKIIDKFRFIYWAFRYL